MDEKKIKPRLGAGLDAIFGNIEQTNKNKIEDIDVIKIHAAPWQPRKLFDESEIEQLSDSIKRYGVLQPILLKKDGIGYKIIAGERRFRATCLAKIATIPAIVVDFNEQQALEVSMIENLQRRDLNPIEKAEGFAFLIEKLNINQEELSIRLGINRSVISNYLRINTLSDDIKQKLISGKITAGHAKILVNKNDASELADEIIENKLSVRDVEAKFKAPKITMPKTEVSEKTETVQIKETANCNIPASNFSTSTIIHSSISNTEEEDEDEEIAIKKANKKGSELAEFESMISQTLDTNVRIEMESSSKGKIILEFTNFANLEKIIEKICL